MPRFRTTQGLDDVIASDGDAAFLRLNARLRPNQLKPGEVAVSMNGRMETDGTWQVREGISAVSGVLSQAGTALYAAETGTDGTVYLIADVAISAADRVGDTVTITTGTAHGLPSGNTSAINVFVNDASVTVDPDGNQTATYVDATNFTYVIAGAAGNETYTPGAGPLARSAILGEDAIVEVHGACLYSDPKDNNEEWIIVATTTEARGFQLSAADVPGSVVVLDYPASTTLSGRIDVTQAFDKVYIFRDGATALAWDGDLTTPGAFAAVPSGTKTQHVVYTAALNTSITSGVVTVSETAHGRSAGDSIKIVAGGATELVDGDNYIIATVPTADTFTFYAEVDNATSTAVEYSTPASLGGGYINMPAAAWGTYHQRRFWMPYTHDGGSSPATRDVKDELIASDILDPTTFDPIGNQYRITAGTADYLVGVHPFDDDRLIAFNRNSIHTLSGVSGALDDVSTVKLTGEIGCTARRSIIGYGGAVYFLSDSGVYSISFLDAYNLRGTELPLSEAIQPWIDRINKDYAENAVGIYHDNRYYLYVPLDDSATNNTCFVYNIINGGWESIDTVATAGWDVLEAIQARSSKVNELYVVTTQGGIHKVEGTARASDQVAQSAAATAADTFEIAGQWRSRQYHLGTMDRKKWHRFFMHIKSDASSASAGSISAIVEDPDQTITLGTIEGLRGSPLASDDGADLRARLGNRRGYGIQLNFASASGRPIIRASQVEGSSAYNSTTSTS